VRFAEQELSGLGDARLGEWREWTETGTFHMRRRLSVEEVAAVGPAVDVRRSPEAFRRAGALPARLRALVPPEVWADEVGSLRRDSG
jgi:hypothetical protein